jgi:DNA-binding transcriptional ArsR family regulator
MTYLIDGRISAWTALGDPTRRAIFERLLEQPQAVHTLAKGLPISRPAVSQHLKVLSDAGLVVARREGKQRIYQVDPEGIVAFRAELQRFWDKTMAVYKAVVEQSPMETSKEE